jgi:hypothetical protein
MPVHPTPKSVNVAVQIHVLTLFKICRWQGRNKGFNCVFYKCSIHVDFLILLSCTFIIEISCNLTTWNQDSSVV